MDSTHPPLDMPVFRQGKLKAWPCCSLSVFHSLLDLPRSRQWCILISKPETRMHDDRWWHKQTGFSSSIFLPQYILFVYCTCLRPGGRQSEMTEIQDVAVHLFGHYCLPNHMVPWESCIWRHINCYDSHGMSVKSKASEDLDISFVILHFEIIWEGM